MSAEVIPGRCESFTSPRLRGEVGLRSNPGEGVPLFLYVQRSRIEEFLTPTLSPQERGEGEERRPELRALRMTEPCGITE